MWQDPNRGFVRISGWNEILAAPRGGNPLAKDSLMLKLIRDFKIFMNVVNMSNCEVY